MKKIFLFLFILFLPVLHINAQEVDFSGTFKGNESGTSSSTGSGTFSGSGTGSLNNEGSIQNYIVYCKVASTLGSVTGDNTSSNYTFSQLGSYYYLNNLPSTPYIPSVSIQKRTIYYCVHKDSGATFYTDATNYLSSVYVPVTLTLGYGSSQFTFNESGTTTSKDSGTYQGSVSGTMSGVVDNFSRSLSYPPAFPTTTGMSYSTPHSNDFYVESFSITSDGVTIPQGQEFALVDLTYTLNFNGTGNPPSGSYMLSFSAGGGTTAGWPQFFQNDSDVYLTNLKNTGIYGSVRVFTAFSASGFYGNTIYFDVIRAEAFKSLTFVATFFVTKNISPINYIGYTNNAFSIIYKSDSNSILNQLQNQSNALTSAGGVNSGMNTQNQLVNSALSDYQKQTDTSAQYGNISDTLFIPDVSVFTQMAPTISLFSSVITGFFTHLGDLSVPLTMFLVFVFISSVLGIHNFVVSSNDRMETKSRRSGSGKGKKGD